MSTTILVILFICAVILVSGFLLLVLTLVPAINQFKSLMVDLEKTSTEARYVAINLRSVSGKIDTDLDKLDILLNTTTETVETVKESLQFVNMRILKKSAGLLALIPAFKFGWKLIKKYKGGNHE